MKNLNILIALIFLFLVSATNAQTKTQSPPKDFFACWKASHEESNEKTKTDIYRSCSYSKFGPSMFRLEIEFFKDGKCKFLHVGPADDHYYVEGKWVYDGKTKIISVLDDKGNLTYKFKIKKVSKDLMKTISLT
jgi:hypothetical protein